MQKRRQKKVTNAIFNTNKTCKACASLIMASAVWYLAGGVKKKLRKRQMHGITSGALKQPPIALIQTGTLFQPAPVAEVANKLLAL
jgi:hypothetical protein